MDSAGLRSVASELVSDLCDDRTVVMHWYHFRSNAKSAPCAVANPLSAQPQMDRHDVVAVGLHPTGYSSGSVTSKIGKCDCHNLLNRSSGARGAHGATTNEVILFNDVPGVPANFAVANHTRLRSAPRDSVRGGRSGTSVRSSFPSHPRWFAGSSLEAVVSPNG